VLPAYVTARSVLRLNYQFDLFIRQLLMYWGFRTNDGFTPNCEYASRCMAWRNAEQR